LKLERIVSQNPPKHHRLLSYYDLRERGIRLSRVQLYRLYREGLFPRPVRIGGGIRNYWIESEIDAYLAAAIAKRDAENEREAASLRRDRRDAAAETAAAASAPEAPAKAKKPAGKALKGRAKEAA
jgi:prophage regulatory protein